MRSENHIIFQWNKPQEVSVYEADLLRKRWKKAVPCILFAVAIIEFSSYIWLSMLLKRMSPENIAPFLSRLAISLFGGYIGITVLVLSLYFVYPGSHAKAECSCQITQKGIQVNGTNLLYRWEKNKRLLVGPTYVSFPFYHCLGIQCFLLLYYSKTYW